MSKLETISQTPLGERIFNLFTLNLFNSQEDDSKFDDYKKPKSIKKVNYKAVIPKISFSNEFQKEKPTILIMDDFIGMANLIDNELGRVECVDVKETFNIISATGSYAAFTVKNLLKDGEPPIDIALLDITLGGVVKGQEYDGVDVAILIKKYYPECVIRFVTGHTLNRHNPEIFQFIKKFEDFFKVKIDETHTIMYNNKEREIYKHIINKNGNRVEALGDTIQEFFDKDKSCIDMTS